MNLITMYQKLNKPEFHLRRYLLNNLFDFLVNLATSPKQQLSFASTPKQFIEASGLAELDRQLVESGGKDGISVAFGSELSVLAIAVTDPIDDPLPDPDPEPPEPPKPQEPPQDGETFMTLYA